jgi:antitoxin ParD1/3/4
LTLFAICGRILAEGESIMTSSLNVSLTDKLRRFVDARASDDDVYSTPSEYIRDLIRRDMEGTAILAKVQHGLEDIKNNRFAKESVLDIMKDYQ